LLDNFLRKNVLKKRKDLVAGVAPRTVLEPGIYDVPLDTLVRWGMARGWVCWNRDLYCIITGQDHLNQRRQNRGREGARAPHFLQSGGLAPSLLH